MTSSTQSQKERPTLLRLRSKSYFHSWERYITNQDGETQIIPKTPIKSTIVQQDLKVILEELSSTEKSGSEDDVKECTVHSKGIELALIVVSLASAVFLVALDEAIITTAIPKITDRFDSAKGIGWYGSAYLLTSCTLRPTFGKVYKLFTPKWIFLGAVATFQIGSLLSGLAPSSKTLIMGRAISGIGSAGVGTGFSVLLADSVPKHKLPVFSSAINSVYSVAAVAAPLAGSVFTTKVSWRWCFLINLPFGIATMAIVEFYVRSDRRAYFKSSGTAKDICKQLDLLGAICFISGIVCLLIVLQWGGTQYTWANFCIIVLLVHSGLCIIAFCVIQFWLQELATIPPRIARQRNIAFGALFAFFIGASATVMEYYLPIWFQTVQKLSPLMSGVMTIPMILGFVVFALIAGFGVSSTGYYVPFMLAGGVFLVLGSSLLQTLRTNSSRWTWIIFQILLGAGCGFGVEQPYLAAAHQLRRLPQVDYGHESR